MNNNNILSSVLGFVGVLSLVVTVRQIYKTIEKQVETDIISEDAIKVIQKPETADKLRRIINDYHNTGKWNKKELESIF